MSAIGKVEVVSLIIGFAMPIIVSVLKQSGLHRLWNLAIALAACGAAGFASAWISGDLRGISVVAAIGIVFASAQAVYQAFLRGTYFEKTLDEITSIIR